MGRATDNRDDVTRIPLQYLFNQITDFSVVPHVPRIGVLGKDSGGNYIMIKVNPDGELQIEKANYTVAIDWDVNNNPIYVGEAAIGSSKGATVWRIKKITWDVNNNPTDVQWASGVETFTKEWDERTSYVYS